MAIRVDSSKCINCSLCELTCSLTLFNEANPKKAAIHIAPCTEHIGMCDVVYCNQCGICADMCPVDAITEGPYGLELNQQICTGCGTCVEACPYNAIFVVPSNNNKPIKCHGCGECAKVCPSGAIKYINGYPSQEV
jgi:ferredoxin